MRGDNEHHNVCVSNPAFPQLKAMFARTKCRIKRTTGLKLPESRWRRVCTDNALERLIEEGRRQAKVTGIVPDERTGLSLIHSVPALVSKR
jgi:transposase-like protein